MPAPVSVTASITYWPAVMSCARAYSSSSDAFPASIVSLPFPSMASRALMARFRSAFSIWAGSIKVFQSPPAMMVSISTPSPIARRSISSTPDTKRPMLTTFGSNAARRPNAGNWLASLAPRLTPASAFETRRSARSLPAISLVRSCGLAGVELALGATAEKCQSIFGSGSGPNGQRP